MLYAAESFLLGGSDQLPVLHKRRRRVGMKGIETKDNHCTEIIPRVTFPAQPNYSRSCAAVIKTYYKPPYLNSHAFFQIGTGKA
jgi:hypothetical protein